METKGMLEIFSISDWKWKQAVIGDKTLIVSVINPDKICPVNIKEDEICFSYIYSVGYRVKDNDGQILFSVEHPTEEELIQKGILGKWEDEGLAVILTNERQWYYRLQGFLAPEGEKIFVPLGTGIGQMGYETINNLPGFEDLVAANPDLRKAVTPPLPKRKK